MAALDDQTRVFLTELRFATLATINADGAPQQTVMWYDMDGDDVLMNTAAGRVKDGNLRRDARVSLCVEDGYRYVAVAGTVTLIDDQAIAQADIARLARRYAPDAAHAERQIANFRREQRITIRLHIERVITRW
jgi:PPOX class probable F420-dependent enzyme